MTTRTRRAKSYVDWERQAARAASQTRHLFITADWKHQIGGSTAILRTALRRVERIKVCQMTVVM